jgi:hypothetical protein
MPAAVKRLRFKLTDNVSGNIPTPGVLRMFEPHIGAGKTRVTANPRVAGAN